jgi:hypothetical protein
VDFYDDAYTPLFSPLNTVMAFLGVMSWKQSNCGEVFTGPRPANLNHDDSSCAKGVFIEQQ